MAPFGKQQEVSSFVWRTNPEEPRHKRHRLNQSELYIQLPVHLKDGFEWDTELIAHRRYPNRLFIALLGNDGTIVALKASGTIVAKIRPVVVRSV